MCMANHLSTVLPPSSHFGYIAQEIFFSAREVDDQLVLGEHLVDDPGVRLVWP